MGSDPWIDKFDILLKVKRIIFRLFVSKPVLARLASPFREHEVELEISHLDNVSNDRVTESKSSRVEAPGSSKKPLCSK